MKIVRVVARPWRPLPALVLLTSALFCSCDSLKGDVGPAGTANVQYSAWTSVAFSGSGTSYVGNLTAPAITQEVLDKADIRVYWKVGSQVLALPYAQNIAGTTYSVHQRFYLGRIELLASYSLSSQEMRYVIIPGGAPVRLGLDLDDYDAVKKAFNLPD